MEDEERAHVANVGRFARYMCQIAGRLGHYFYINVRIKRKQVIEHAFGMESAIIVAREDTK